MAPIPVRKPKEVNPLPLESTLGDLSTLRAQDVDLSKLLEHPTKDPGDDGLDIALKRSHDFVGSVRSALGVDTDVVTQGDRVEVVRATLQEIEEGYSNSNYYGDGGGFLSGSQVGGGSQASPAGGRTRNPNQSLRPITIRQIFTAEQTHSDAEFVIDGAETTQVTLVAQVVAASKQATNITYKLNDGTAEIKAKHWLDNSEEEAIGENEHAYVRVVGTLKTFSGERQINAVHTRLVTDPMEIYYHLIEAQLVHLHYTRGSAGAAPGAASAPSVYQAGGKGHQSKFANFPPLQRHILEVLDQLMPQHEQGVHVTTIANGLSVKATIDEIGATMEKLAEEGHIYATTDDEHFAIS